MSLNIIVCAKQVMDPETPLSAFNVDEAAKRVVPAQGIPPVVNGFCENAVEAALKIKEAAGDATITVISVGTDFVMDVMKKPLSMGADQMILIQDPAAENLDALGTATVLSKAIEKIGEADIVIFSDDGGIKDVIRLGESGNFYYRLDIPSYHTILIHSPLLVIHEIFLGN